MAFDDGLPQPPGPRDIGHALERLRDHWGRFAAFGALAMFLGFVALGLGEISTLAAVYLVAIFVILIGGVDLALALQAHRWSNRLLAGSVGLLYIVAGAFALARPMSGALGLTLMVGVSLIATGSMRIAFATLLPAGPKWRVVLAGVVTLLLGALIVADWPGNSEYVLGLFLGVDMLVYGGSWLSFAMFLRKRLPGRG